MVFLENIFQVFKWQLQSLPGYFIARNYSPALSRKRLPPITWFPRDEQGVAILSAPLGSWRAVPGKAVACTVISCTGWYHRPSNCTNYYLSLESGKRKRSVGGTLQDALETGKATSSTAEAWQQSCQCHTFASSCTIFGQSSFNHPEKHPTRRNIPVMQMII